MRWGRSFSWMSWSRFCIHGGGVSWMWVGTARSGPEENNCSKIYHFVTYRPWAEHPLQVLREMPGLESPSSPTSGADAELWSWAKTFRLMKRKDMSNLNLGVKHFLELSLNKVWNSWTGNKLIMGFYNMHFPYKALKCSIGFMGLVADLLLILMKILGFLPVCVVVCVWGPFSTPDWSVSSHHCRQWSLDGPFLGQTREESS